MMSSYGSCWLRSSRRVPSPHSLAPAEHIRGLAEQRSAASTSSEGFDLFNRSAAAAAGRCCCLLRLLLHTAARPVFRAGAVTKAKASCTVSVTLGRACMLSTRVVHNITGETCEAPDGA